MTNHKVEAVTYLLSEAQSTLDTVQKELDLYGVAIAANSSNTTIKPATKAISKLAKILDIIEELK